MHEIYTEHILDNGLTVLLQENHSAPIDSHCIWYRVGSRNEVPGKTGISHWVEHMQFRGTERYPEQEAVKKILREGGDLNAYTGRDGTAFYEIMPADKINIALEIEADRMENSVFDPEVGDLERTVIISELELGKSHETPSCKLAESVRKAVFPHHPYGRETLGTIEDLNDLTREDLYKYYRTWYAPNNAIVSVVGDFNTDEMLQNIEAAYCKELLVLGFDYEIEHFEIKPNTVAFRLKTDLTEEESKTLEKYFKAFYG